MQEGGPGLWAPSTKPFAASLPSTWALPHPPGRSPHHTARALHRVNTPSSAIMHLCGRSGGEVGRPYPPPFLRRRALPPPSVPPAQAHYHATDADLLRSGELVDEPGSGAGPRRAYPSFHHVRPASMLRVCRVSMVPPAPGSLHAPLWLRPLKRARAEPLNRSGPSARADTKNICAADFAAVNTQASPTWRGTASTQGQSAFFMVSARVPPCVLRLLPGTRAAAGARL